MAHRRVSQLIADPTAPADTQRYQDTPTHAHTHTHTALTVADDGWRRSAAAVPGSGPSAVKKTGRPDGIKLARRRHTTIGSGLAFRFGKEGPRDPEKGGGGERTSQRASDRERERERERDTAPASRRRGSRPDVGNERIVSFPRYFLVRVGSFQFSTLVRQLAELLRANNGTKPS